MKQKTKRKMALASPLLLPPAAGFSTWKISEHVRTGKLKEKKLELEIKLEEIKSKPERVADDMQQDLAYKIFYKKFSSGEHTSSDDLVDILIEDKELLNEFGVSLVSEKNLKLKAEREAEQIEGKIKQVKSKIETQEALAKVDGVIGGGLIIVPVVVWLLIHKFSTSIGNLGKNLRGIIEDLKSLRKMREEGVNLDDVSAEVRKQKAELDGKKEEKTQLKKPKKKKRISASKKIQKELYDALQSHIGDDAGALSKAVVANLGKNTAQKMINDPSMSYDILCDNADRLNVYLDKRGVDLGKLLTVLERSFAEYSEDFEPVEMTKEMGDLMNSLAMLNGVKAGSVAKTSELEKIITDAGFIIENKKGRGGGHRVIFYVDSEGEKQFVRSSDGRVRSFPNPKDSVEKVAVSEVIKTCAQNLEQRIEELR